MDHLGAKCILLCPENVTATSLLPMIRVSYSFQDDDSSLPADIPVQEAQVTERHLGLKV